MGVERAVTRWYVLRQPIVEEITALQTRLTQLEQQASETQTESAQTPIEHDLLNTVELQLKVAQMRLKALGPCPKPMMG